MTTAATLANPFTADRHCSGLLSLLLADPLPSPRSDHIREQIADRLEEIGVEDRSQDWSERAEFIRLQVKLENWNCIYVEGFRSGSSWQHNCRSKRSGEFPCHALRARERELLKRYGASWAHQLSPTFSDLYDLARVAGQSLPPWDWSHGFPAHVTVDTLAHLIGEPCELCGGRGETAWPTVGAESYSQHRQNCPTCHGHGFAGGIGVKLVETCPLVGVTVGDREPWVEPGTELPNWWAWFNGAHLHDDSVRSEAAYLPQPIYGRLKTYPNFAHGDGATHYPNRTAALTALSHAVIDTLRTWAGQEPVTWPKEE